MTYRELAKKEHPERVMSPCQGGVYGCPHEIMTDAKELCEGRLGDVTDEECTRCWDQEISDQPSQSAKADKGKPRLCLVPRKIIWDIAKVREYGCEKYRDPDNWKKVEAQRYRDAAFRHFMAYLDEPNGVDAESCLPHLAHLACNIAFLCELEAQNE